MKFNTPRSPAHRRRLSLLEKGGVFVRRGGVPQKAGLAHAPFRAAFADRDALAFVEGVGYATRLGEVTAARITFHASFIIASRYSFIAER